MSRPLLAVVFAVAFLMGLFCCVYVDFHLTDGCPDIAQISQWEHWQQDLYQRLYWPVSFTMCFFCAWLAVRVLFFGPLRSTVANGDSP